MVIIHFLDTQGDSCHLKTHIPSVGETLLLHLWQFPHSHFLWFLSLEFLIVMHLTPSMDPPCLLSFLFSPYCFNPILIFFFSAFHYVMCVSSLWVLKQSPQTRWLNTTETYSLTVEEVKSPVCFFCFQRDFLIFISLLTSRIFSSAFIWIF